jgi:hypothetical protein
MKEGSFGPKIIFINLGRSRDLQSGYIRQRLPINMDQLLTHTIGTYAYMVVAISRLASPLGCYTN